MSFSLLKLALLAGAAQGAILALLLWTRPVNREANRIFAFLLFLLTIHLTLVAFDERDFFMRFPHLSHLTWLIPVLYGPLTLIYVRRLTHIAPAFQKKELLYLLPFLVWLIVQLPYYFQTAAAKRAYLGNWELSVQDDFGLINQLTNFVHLLFFGLCIRVYHKHEHRIPDYYSDLSKVRLLWLQRFLYITFAITAIGVFIFYAKKLDWPYLSGLYPFHFLGVVVLIYWTAYQAIAHPVLFSAEVYPSPEEQAEEAPPSRLDNATQQAMAGQLKKLMEEEHLYLNSELTLKDLSDRLQSNKQYVSEVLNSYIGKTFYDFVNDYRIEAFKRLAADPSNSSLTLLGLALEAGFNSKATFNAVFKKKTGLTPSAFYKEQQLNEV
ncbi:MAG: helix-turn-helix domain-containing protein [Saprospiraceae bacterium]|jgi:AraC-like DNA-binding protein|nr:helix-turn-helix domain-containing protein [Saprospiraceae bacterium]